MNYFRHYLSLFKQKMGFTHPPTEEACLIAPGRDPEEVADYYYRKALNCPEPQDLKYLQQSHETLELESKRRKIAKIIYLLKTTPFKLNGGGVKIDGKRYPKSAAAILEEFAFSFHQPKRVVVALIVLI